MTSEQRRTNAELSKLLSEHMARIGAKGGKAGSGVPKANGSENARKAVQARWKKYRSGKQAMKSKAKGV
jgi:hypothetical protein